MCVSTSEQSSGQMKKYIRGVDRERLMAISPYSSYPAAFSRGHSHASVLPKTSNMRYSKGLFRSQVLSHALPEYRDYPSGLWFSSID
jgi:hypothetical protein